MNDHAYKKGKNKSSGVPDIVSNQQSNSGSAFQFADIRPGTIAQRKQQEMADNSPRSQQMAHLQAMLNNSPQAKKAAQLKPMADNYLASQFIPKKESQTGLPDNLKTGSENPSGHSLNRVNQPLVRDSAVIQPTWYDKAGQKRLLELLTKIKGLKKVLKKYPLWKYDSFEYRRKTINPHTDAILSDETSHVKGFIRDKGIAVWGGLNDGEAAATIVHEAKHGQQRQNLGVRGKDDTAENVRREIAAHLREEAFRKAKGIAPKRAEFREGGDTDEEAIKRYVRETYGGEQRIVRCYPGTDREFESDAAYWRQLQGLEKVKFKYGTLK